MMQMMMNQQGNIEATKSSIEAFTNSMKGTTDALFEMAKTKDSLYKGEKPKTTAVNQMIFFQEWQTFQRWLNDNKIEKPTTMFNQARFASEDRAKTCVEDIIIDRFGDENGFQEALKDGATYPNDFWE